jgi:hypothetical protein
VDKQNKWRRSRLGDALASELGRSADGGAATAREFAALRFLRVLWLSPSASSGGKARAMVQMATVARLSARAFRAMRSGSSAASRATQYESLLLLRAAAALVRKPSNERVMASESFAMALAMVSPAAAAVCRCSAASAHPSAFVAECFEALFSIVLALLTQHAEQVRLCLAALGPALRYMLLTVSCLLCTGTFYANLAHSLTRSP